MFNHLTKVGAAAIAIAMFSAPALAQNFTLNPTFGTFTLQSGFTPDPYQIDVVAGGSNDASNVGSQCAGFVAEAPDVRLHFQGGLFNEINFSTQSNSDTTLVINDPNGTWHCNDDGGNGLNALLSFVPVSGQYDIWVGTYGSSTANATLAISELPYGGGSTPPPPPPPPTSGPDFTLSPAFGTFTLQSGFTPDPYQINVVAGGSNDASNWSNGTCAGFVADAPDVRLHFQGGAFNEINFSTLSSSDTTLVINDPNGDWWCNDDGGNGLNALLSFVPISGQYDIWVGTYGSSTADATLAISELPYGGGSTPPPPPPPPPSGPDFTLNPTFGTYTLQSGFTPDPFEVNVIAGGNNDASAWSNGTCRGFVADAPDARVHFQGGSFAQLYFSVSSDSDTTIVINDPNGNWHCDDDGGNIGLNPALFMAPVSGQYDIWVGTYGSSTADAVLAISELYSY